MVVRDVSYWESIVSSIFSLLFLPYRAGSLNILMSVTKKGLSTTACFMCSGGEGQINNCGAAEKKFAVVINVKI